MDTNWSQDSWMKLCTLSKQGKFAKYDSANLFWKQMWMFIGMQSKFRKFTLNPLKTCAWNLQDMIQLIFVEKLEQTDLREGTHPEKSVWRPFGKVVRKSFFIRYFANLNRWRKNPCCLFIRKDSVRVPADLPVGDYVLSLCWDVWGGAQVAFPLYSISCFLQQIWCSFDQNLFLGRFGCLVLQSGWSTTMALATITMKMTVRFIQRRNMRSLRVHFRIKSISLSLRWIKINVENNSSGIRFA